MNIFRSNWNQILPFIQSTLKKSDYIAIDFEMTGLLASQSLRNSNIDSVELFIQLRYWKTKENVKRFLPIQMGLCGFRILNENNIEAYPFNIYIYPFAIENGLDRVFSFSISSLTFLSNYDYDFNKTFNDGVYFLSKEIEIALKEQEKFDQIRNQINKQNRQITPGMLAFYQLNEQNIKKFFSDNQQTQLSINIKFIKKKVQMYLLDNVQKIAGDQKYYVTYDLESNFGRSEMVIHKGQMLEETNLDSIQKAEEADIIGVRKIIDQIIDQKTPLIFHNGFTDLCHLYDKFIYSLPDKQDEFKSDVKKLFPLIYDTKYMICTSTLLTKEVNQNSELKNSFKSLLKYYNNSPIIQIAPEFTQYKIDVHELSEPETQTYSYEHEAGFDALMTGYVYFKSVGLLQNGRINNDVFKINHDRLKFYANRLPLGSIQLPFDLDDGVDNYHDKKSDIFYIQILQRRLISAQQIQEYFETLGMKNMNLFLSYGNNFEYFLIFSKVEDADILKRKLNEGILTMNINGDDILVSFYDNYRKQIKKRIQSELEIREMPTCLENIEESR